MQQPRPAKRSKNKPAVYKARDVWAMLYRIECFVRAMQDSTCLEDSANGWESCQVIDEAATKSPGLSCLFTLVLGPMDCHGRRMRVPVRSHSRRRRW